MLKPWIASTLVVAGLACSLRLRPGGRHGVPASARGEPPVHDRPRARREPLVHRVRPRDDRPHHAERDDHRVSARVAGQPAVRDHGRRGRQPLVHRALPGPDREDHDAGRNHGVPDPDAGRAALGHHGASRTATSGSRRRTSTRSAVIHRRTGAIDEYPSGDRPVSDVHRHRGGRKRLVHRGDREQHRSARSREPTRPDRVPAHHRESRFRGTSARGLTETSGSRSSPAATSGRSRRRATITEYPVHGEPRDRRDRRRARPGTACGSPRTTRATSATISVDGDRRRRLRHRRLSVRDHCWA